MYVNSAAVYFAGSDYEKPAELINPKLSLFKKSVKQYDSASKK